MQVNQPVGRLAHGERTLTAQELFSGLDTVGVEAGLGLAHSAQEEFEWNPGGEFDECGLGDVGMCGVGAERDPLEHGRDRGRRVDADRCGLQGGRDVRMLRRDPFAAEAATLGGGGADGDELRGIAAGRPGRRRDQPHRVVEALRLREPDVAELGPRASRHLGGDPGQQHVGITAHPRDQVGDLTRPASLICSTSTCVVPGDRTERRKRIGPRRTAALSRSRSSGCAGGRVPCFDPAPTH